MMSNSSAASDDGRLPSPLGDDICDASDSAAAAADAPSFVIAELSAAVKLAVTVFGVR